MRCLYVIYWGATEAIGVSGTVPTVKRLSRELGEEVTLLSFDKPSDKVDEARVASVASSLARDGVSWRDLGYTKRPANLSTAWDIAKGVAHGGYLVARRRIDVVHGRTYVGSLIAMILKGAFPRVRFVCHPDGFWPDERIDDGVWREGSRAHRLASWLERKMYDKADGIIVLSERAREHLVRRDPRLAGKPIVVVHTSVDESRFAVRACRRAEEPLRLVYLGSLGGRRMTREVFRFLSVARMRGAVCTVATQTPLTELEPALSEAGLTPGDVGLRSVCPADVPALLADQHAGFFMLRAGRSNIATSATKVGEYLAAGLPVAITPDCGDLDVILESTRTGVVFREHSDAAYGHVLERLEALTLDAETPARCRLVAEGFMGVAHCAKQQAMLHRSLLAGVSLERGGAGHDTVDDQVSSVGGAS